MTRLKIGVTMPILATGRLRAIVTIHPPILAEARHQAVGLNGDRYSRYRCATGGNRPDMTTISVDTSGVALAVAARL
jgi:hypothetical protein